MPQFLYNTNTKVVEDIDIRIEGALDQYEDDWKCLSPHILQLIKLAEYFSIEDNQLKLPNLE